MSTLCKSLRIYVVTLLILAMGAVAHSTEPIQGDGTFEAFQVITHEVTDLEDTTILKQTLLTTAQGTLDGPVRADVTCVVDLSEAGFCLGLALFQGTVAGAVGTLEMQVAFEVVEALLEQGQFVIEQGTQGLATLKGHGRFAGHLEEGGNYKLLFQIDTLFDVILVAPGDTLIQVIKEVRALTGLGLKEAKELVESAPQPIITGVSREKADQVAIRLEAAGAGVEVIEHRGSEL